MLNNSDGYDPFAATDAIIRDLPHVHVSRLAAQDGRRCRFKKVFRAEGLGDTAQYWRQRESDFLLDFIPKHLKHVAQLAGFERDDDGTLDYIVTGDAGVTLEDWLSVQARYANGTTALHPFQHTGAFLQLLRACLLALREIHRVRIIHCDIKADNICLPFAPYPYQAGRPLSIDYANVRLIDFAFSITPERPLEQPLPILPAAAYQSTGLKNALRDDIEKARTTGFAVEKLDYRADFHSLGYLARKILDTGLLQPAGAGGHQTLTDAVNLVKRLEAIGNSRYPSRTLPHDGLIVEIDSWLSKLTDLTANQKFIIVRANDIGFFDALRVVPPDTPTPVASQPPSVQQISSSSPTPLLPAQNTPTVIPRKNYPERPHKRSLSIWLFAITLAFGAGAYRLVQNDGLAKWLPNASQSNLSQPMPPESIPLAPEKTIPVRRICTAYSEDQRNYANCQFQQVTFYAWNNPEGVNFSNANGLPAWIEKGLDENGIYRQNELVNAIRKGFKKLRGANLQGANLQNADLSDANMKEANLQEANLSGAEISGVDWQYADLTGAVWRDGSKCMPSSIGRCVN